MTRQYGSNGVNSDGSLMNVGNSIWDAATGGKPSVRLFPDKNAMARTTPPWLLGTEITKNDASGNTKDPQPAAPCTQQVHGANQESICRH